MKKLCRNKVMNVATLEDKVSDPDRETKSRQVMRQTFLVATGMLTIQETLLQQEPTEMLSRHKN